MSAWSLSLYLSVYMDVAIGEYRKKVHYEIPMQLPYHRNDKFVGRAEELSRIHEAFRESGSPSGSLRVETLHGTGGIEKTQIALEYAYRFEVDYSTIFWVNGESLQATIQSFCAIAQHIFNYHIRIQQSPTPDYQLIAHELGMTGLVDSSSPSKVSSEPGDESRVVDVVKGWFSNKQNSRWLLIFDNVDDIQEFDISNFFPYSTNGGCAIITSRRPDCANYGRSELAIERLDEESAVRLLLNVGKEIIIQGKYLTFQ